MDNNMPLVIVNGGFNVGDKVRVCVPYRDGSRLEITGEIVGFEDFIFLDLKIRNARVHSSHFGLESVQSFSLNWLSHNTDTRA